MKRRSFVKASMLTGVVAGMSSMVGEVAAKAYLPKAPKVEFYELRVYTLKNAAQQQLVEEYWQRTAIPTYNKYGSKNIGVFTEQNPEGQSKLYVLIPFKSMSDFTSMPDNLARDDAYQKHGAVYLDAPAKEPAYERIQSSLLRAFAGMPKMEVPENKTRMFELRRYESATEAAGKKKIDMFDNLGEISVFKKVGLTPVFFGETIIGEMLPNLTYMITFDDMAEHDKNWKTFGADPDWRRIRSTPGYEDAKIVSRITRTFLVPTSYSQV